MDVRADGQRVEDGAIDSGSNVLRTGSRLFRSHDVGKALAVLSGRNTTVGTISRVTSASEVVLSVSASQNFSDASVIWGTDDSAALQAIANATGVLSFSAHRYVIASPVFMPNGLRIFGRPGAYLSSIMAPTGQEIYNPLTTINTQATTRSTALAADVVVGSDAISVDANIAAVGEIVRISDNAGDEQNHVFYYVVRAVSGPGPYTVHLDRPVVYPFIATDPVLVVSARPTDIRLDGEGLVIEGTGDTGIQLWGATKCRLSDYTVDGPFANWATTVDLGSDSVVVADVVAKGGNHGWAFSSNEACELRRALATGSPDYGVYCWDTFGHLVADVRSVDNDVGGLSLSSNGGTVGSVRTRIVGGDFGSNAFGIVSAAGVLTTQTTIRDAAIKGNKHVAVYAAAASTVQLEGCDLGPGIDDTGNTFAASGVGAALPAVLAEGGAAIEVSGGRVHFDGQLTGTTPQYGAVANGSGSRIHLRDVTIQIDAVPAVVIGAAACDGPTTVELDGTRIVGAGAGNANAYGLGATAGSTVRTGAGSDISAVQSANRHFGAGTFT